MRSQLLCFVGFTCVALEATLVSTSAPAAPQRRAPVHQRGPTRALLDKKISVRFEEEAFLEAIEVLKRKTGLEMQIDKDALEDNDPRVCTLTADRVSVREILHRLTAQDPTLGYIVLDDLILFTTRQKAEAMLAEVLVFRGLDAS